MYCIHIIKKKIIAVFTVLFAAAAAMAQDAAPAAERTVMSGNNLLAVLLVIVMLVLAAVGWGLGQVLLILSRQMMAKNKNTSKVLATLPVMVFVLLSQTALAEDTGTAAVKVLPNYGGLSPTAFYLFAGVVAIEVIAVLFLALAVKRVYAELLPQTKTVVKEYTFSTWWKGLDKKLFTRAVPVEREADVMLDHDYDGIKELDNALPPWWKYGFYITIAVALIYLLNFHVLGSGKNPAEEYMAEIQKAKEEKAIFEENNKDKVDENNVVMANADGIKAGQRLFEANCVACHLKDGGGIVGPNLTDDYWLHKGSLNDIYHTIKTGYPDKGMQPWSNLFSPKEISFLASYIKSLKGTKPAAPKEKQGEYYTDETAVAGDAASVAKPVVTPDSVAVKK
jgi:cytochrome c oxidase cbb3-type subunit III